MIESRLIAGTLMMTHSRGLLAKTIEGYRVLFSSDGFAVFPLFSIYLMPFFVLRVFSRLGSATPDRGSEQGGLRQGARRGHQAAARAEHRDPR